MWELSTSSSESKTFKYLSLWISRSFSKYHDHSANTTNSHSYLLDNDIMNVLEDRTNTFAIFHVVMDASRALERASRNWLDCFNPNSGISTKLRAAVKWRVAYEIVLLIGAQNARLYSFVFVTSRTLYFSLCNYLNTKIIGSARYVSSLMFMLCRIKYSDQFLNWLSHTVLVSRNYIVFLFNI